VMEAAELNESVAAKGTGTAGWEVRCCWEEPVPQAHPPPSKCESSSREPAVPRKKIQSCSREWH